MTCINDGNTHFGFTHDPSTIYYSPDIDTGIGATVTPAPGDVFNATIDVHNQGIMGNGEVALCVCPPGTSITTILSYLTGPLPNIAACDPLNPNATTNALISWTVPTGYSHFCLAAMVKDTALGSADFDSPIDAATMTFTVPFNPNANASAQCNVSLVQGGGRPAPPPPPGPAPRFCVDFAFAVGNPVRKGLRTQIVAYPIGVRDERIIAALSKQSQIRGALERGAFRAPMHSGLAVGRERVIQRFAPPGRKVEGRDRKNACVCAPFGHFGEVTAEVAAQLAVTPLRSEQTMSLAVDEVRQGLVHICAPLDARPGELFGVDIRHEVLARGDAAEQRVIGGLVVVLRIPHPEDRKTR